MRRYPLPGCVRDFGRCSSRKVDNPGIIMLSNLRIIGIVIGCLGLVSTFYVYRGPKWKRANFVLLSLFNISLIAVSSNPDLVNFARDMLALQEYQYGRILALLIISNLFLLFFSFGSRSRLENLRLQMDRLIRNLGTRGFEEGDGFKEKMRPVMVLIPAYNEARNLAEMLPLMPGQIDGRELGVLVVDDGSEDETKDVVRSCGQLVVSNLINRGGGAALRLGYDIFRKGGVRICVTMDGDGQHRPEDLRNLLGPIFEDRYDFVIGSRLLGRRERDSLFRLLGVYVFGRLISLLLGTKITDPSSGFRAFKMDAADSLNLYEDQYHTSELIIEAVKKGMRIGEVPITILRRRHGHSKKGANWKYGIRFARTIIKTWWR